MRNMIGWALAALMGMGIGCGGSKTSSAAIGGVAGAGGVEEGGGDTDGVPDQCEGLEPDGGSFICEVCKATGGGVFFLDGKRVTFGLNAIPDAHPGTGFEGEGISAKGHIEIQLHQSDDIFGKVDTLLGCEKESDGDTSAKFSGELRGGGRFLVTVTDAGEPGRADTIAFSNGISFEPMELEQGGNLQVQGFDRCELQCPEGTCWGPCSVCVPCAPPPPAECPAGQVWSSETLRCECPAGQVWSSETSSCVCPSGQVWSSETLTCVCPAGTTWSPVTQTCVSAPDFNL